jgi:hypothetical protein
MKVKELINELQKFDKETEVVVSTFRLAEELLLKNISEVSLGKETKTGIQYVDLELDYLEEDTAGSNYKYLDGMTVNLGTLLYEVDDYHIFISNDKKEINKVKFNKEMEILYHKVDLIYEKESINYENLQELEGARVTHNDKGSGVIFEVCPQKFGVKFDKILKSEWFFNDYFDMVFTVGENSSAIKFN